MLVISKASKDSQGFINSVLNAGAGKSLLLSAAVAKILADRLELPATAVKDADNYFTMHLQLKICRPLDTLNELMMLDVEKITVLVKDFYLQRYAALYPNKTILIRDSESAVLDVFSIRRFIPQGVLDALTSQPAKYMSYYNGLNKLLDELDEYSATLRNC